MCVLESTWEELGLNPSVLCFCCQGRVVSRQKYFHSFSVEFLLLGFLISVKRS